MVHTILFLGARCVWGRGSDLGKGRACCPSLGHLAPVWLYERVLVSLSFLGVGDETILSQSPLDPEEFRPIPHF